VCRPAGWDDRGGWEPLERWRFWARVARALLLAASRVRQRNWVWTREEIRGLAGQADVRGPIHMTDDLAAAMRRQRARKDEPAHTLNFISLYVNDWLLYGDVRPRLHVSGGREARATLVLAPETWSTEHPCFPLFGVLGMQLAFAVFSERGVAFCSACGIAFDPGRILRQGERHYCDPCRDSGAPQRAASAAYRKRQRQNATRKGGRSSPR
jgi:hypothetical protein